MWRGQAGLINIIGLWVLTLAEAGGTPIGAQERNAPPDIRAAPKDHVSDFLEDPFVTKYRKKFFCRVFRRHQSVRAGDGGTRRAAGEKPRRREGAGLAWQRPHGAGRV